MPKRKDRQGGLFPTVLALMALALTTALGVAWELDRMGAKAAPTPRPPVARKAPRHPYDGATYCIVTAPGRVACDNGYDGRMV